MYQDDHDGVLPYADHLYHVGIGWTDPIDALAPYLEGVNPPQVDENGVIQSDAPFRCPSDPRIANERGISYGYTPSQFMPSLVAFPLITKDIAAKMTTIGMYDKAPWKQWIFIDLDEWHPRTSQENVSRRNTLRFDGSVGPASLSDIHLQR